MKLWVRYEPGTVDNGGSHIANGVTDQGIIYVAVGDWTGQEGQNDDGELKLGRLWLRRKTRLCSLPKKELILEMVL